VGEGWCSGLRCVDLCTVYCAGWWPGGFSTIIEENEANSSVNKWEIGGGDE
jgi:hypothetical protein